MEENIYKKAVLLYGAGSQLTQATEECAELIVAIRHFLRCRCDIVALAEEVADVEIMMAQIREIVGGVIVDEIKKRKLIRLKERLENE